MKFKTLLASALCSASLCTQGASSALLGWNNLGMHCMDSDYSVFSILPPYNTIEAQLIVGGKLITSASSGYTLAYEAIVDPDLSINTSSIGKGNFYEWTPLLYGPLAGDSGLAGWGMPGPANTPRQMLFENFNAPAPNVSTPVNWFRAEGIPITPYDDQGKRNPYPLMRLTARDASKQIVAQSDIVLPVSDEMDCRVCHGSNTQTEAMPADGWSTDPNPEREYRLNILKLHDEHQFASHRDEYTAALADRKYNPAGLYASVVSDRHPVLCAACHASEALGTRSFGNIPPLTAAVHTKHASVTDAAAGKTLDDVSHRSACYRCHPGSATKCLRGSMGSAVALDGSMEMQCQSCHGKMSQVGSSTRVGWFMEPNCQSCHTGTATKNSGQIRFTSVFDNSGNTRLAADQTFATNPNTPAPGLSLYRFSKGHGGLQCSACHGSTHAEFPSSHRNDNLQSQNLQGHTGVVADCTACHATMPSGGAGGPHGMHPIGQLWITGHHDWVSQLGLAQCQSCHGADSRGTVLSRAQGDRTFNVENVGEVKFFRGATIGCYTCHKGPSSSTMNTSVAPTVANVTVETQQAQPVVITLPVSGAGATVRIISQPPNGSVGLANNVATYYPDPTFSGADTFTFAAYDGAKNSALGTGTVYVAATPSPVKAPVITAAPSDQTVGEGTLVSFSVSASGTEPLSYKWSKAGMEIAGATGSTLVLGQVTASAAGTYTVTVSNPAGSASASAKLIVNVPVTITQQPQPSTTVIEGQDVTFTVAATGTEPLKYQWSKDGAPISGATSATLPLQGVKGSQAGIYRVVVNNPAGSVTSQPAQLIVIIPVVITSQPQPVTVVQGQTATLSVVASGTSPLTYQWLKNGIAISGATANTLSFPSAALADSGKYRVVVSNAAGSVNSDEVALTVQPPPNIPPFVTITKPADGSTFSALAKIVLTAEAWDKDGSVASVRFYANGGLIGNGKLTTSTGVNGGKLYSLTWTKVQAGSYLVTAKATDNLGLENTSTAITVTAGRAAAQITAVSVAQEPGTVPRAE